jgi:hypothetical protein
MRFKKNKLYLNEEEFEHAKIVLKIDPVYIYPAREFILYLRCIKNAASNLYHSKALQLPIHQRLLCQFNISPEEHLIAHCDVLLYRAYDALIEAGLNMDNFRT